MGDRNVMTYAKDCNISRELLGMMVSGKIKTKPTMRTLRKLVSEEAKPANGVTLETLLKAVGDLPADSPQREGEKPPRQYVEKGEGGENGENREIWNAEQVANSAEPAESSTRAMSLMIDELIRRGFDRTYSIEAREGLYAVVGAKSMARVVIVDGFAGPCKRPRAMSAIIKSLLLDSVVSDLNSNRLSQSAYAILTDRKDIFQEMAGLPRFAAKEVVVAMADPEHQKLRKFLSITPDGGTTDWTMGEKDGHQW